MHSLIRLFKNPYAIIFAAAHWGLVLILFLESQARNPSFDNWHDALAFSLLITDSPAIILAALLWLPTYALDYQETFWFGTVFTGILTVTFQWLIAGKFVFNMFSPVQSRMTTLSLKDE